MKKTVHIIGIILILFGCFLIINAFSGITGFAVFEAADGKISILLSVLFILVGMVLINTSRASRDYRERESKLKEILRDRFSSLSSEERHDYNKALRRHYEKEQKRREYESKNPVNEANNLIFISNSAIERSKKDAFVSRNLKEYLIEIGRISRNPDERPQEKIGEFSVSPRGRSGKGIRVAWHLNSNGNIFIDDLLYHKDRFRFIDDWNHKVKNRIIRREYYEKKGYRSYSGAF